MSGVGKGVTTASIGKILKEHGYTVTAIKIDPYLNYDAGTLRPTEHGEVWVTDDGGEIDQDLASFILLLISSGMCGINWTVWPRYSPCLSLSITVL